MMFDNGYSFSVVNGKASVMFYDGCQKEVVIPAMPGGYPVTSIAEHAFANRSSLKSVTIPEGVTRIYKGAFEGCIGLTTVTIPGSVTDIGDSAFCGCTALTSLTIPGSVTTIESGAFCGCTGLTKMTIPDSVTSIGDWAFCGCTGLTAVAIPDSVTSIGDWAFSGCTSLTTVTIPGSVTTIGSHAFCGCTGLKSAPGHYKATNIDKRRFVCRGFEFTPGKEYLIEGELCLCRNGFHFCENLFDVFSYYCGNLSDFAVWKCEVGETCNTDENGDSSVDSKLCTDRITLVERLSREELIHLLNV